MAADCPETALPSSTLGGVNVNGGVRTACPRVCGSLSLAELEAHWLLTLVPPCELLASLQMRACEFPDGIFCFVFSTNVFSMVDKTEPECISGDVRNFRQHETSSLADKPGTRFLEPGVFQREAKVLFA